jgi:hypothetical protein
MADRQAWFAKAWAVWGGKGKPDKPVEAPSMAKPAAVATTAAATLASIPNVPQSWVDNIASLSAWQSAGEKVAGFAKAGLGNPLMAGILALVVAGIWFGPQICARVSRLWRAA